MATHSFAHRRVPDPGARTSPPLVHDVLRSAGEPLDGKIQHAMSARFGWDFSRVRVHADPTAARSAADLHADAYTVGRHIAFAPGRYAPSTTTGRHLLAHELTHVIQQSGSTAPAGPLAVSAPHCPAEHQAALAAEGGHLPAISVSPVMVHRSFVMPVQHSGLHGADAIIPLDRFITYIEEVERANPGDQPSDTLSRLRVQYYGGEGWADFAKFSQLIPDAPAYDSYTTIGEFPDVRQHTARLG